MTRPTRLLAGVAVVAVMTVCAAAAWCADRIAGWRR